MKRTLVTGADGFVGQWLLRRLLEERYAITGLIRGQTPALTTLDTETAQPVRWRSFELARLEELKGIVADTHPEVVFHLAAQASVADSVTAPAQTIETNLVGTINLLEACRAHAPDASVLIVGSADAYGAKDEDAMPLSEEAQLEPRNPYAASKAAAEIVATQYAHSGWVKVVMTRSFNHAGPGQSTRFAVAAFAKQIADVKAGRAQPQIRVGALEPRRDYSDVRDVANAYVLLTERGTPGGVYNVCSGQERSMREILEQLIELAGVQIDVREDPALLRATEVQRLAGSAARLQRDTGWQPRIPFRQTLSDMLRYYAG